MNWRLMGSQNLARSSRGGARPPPESAASPAATSALGRGECAGRAPWRGPPAELRPPRRRTGESDQRTYRPPPMLIFAAAGLGLGSARTAARAAVAGKFTEHVCVYDSAVHVGAAADRHLVLPVTFGAGTFSCAQELRNLLQERGCDVDAWGGDFQGKATKTVDELWEEIEMGECDLRIDDDGIRRQLNVVKVRVRRPNDRSCQLIEASQIFSDGRSRKRGLPLSEKMFPGETALDAAERGIVEELGSAIREQHATWPIEVQENSLIEWAETRRSQSYPDLLSHYLLFQVDAVVYGLPSESFSTVEYDDACARASDDTSSCRLKLAHTWDWVELLTIDGELEGPPTALEAASLAEDSDSCVMYVSEDRSYSVVQQGARRISGRSR